MYLMSLAVPGMVGPGTSGWSKVGAGRGCDLWGRQI